MSIHFLFHQYFGLKTFQYTPLQVDRHHEVIVQSYCHDKHWYFFYLCYFCLSCDHCVNLDVSSSSGPPSVATAVSISGPYRIIVPNALHPGRDGTDRSIVHVVLCRVEGSRVYQTQFTTISTVSFPPLPPIPPPTEFYVFLDE